MAIERKRERAGQVHSPERRLGDVGLFRRFAAQQAHDRPQVADDDRDGEHDVDRVQDVEADLEIGAALDLHEGDVAHGGRQRHAEEDDGGNGHDQSEHAPSERPQLARDEVEADLLVLLEPERRSDQHHVQPGDDRQLRRPADREIEEIPEDDLDDERDEHDAEQAGDDVLGASSHPVDRALRSSSGMRFPPGSRRPAKRRRAGASLRAPTRHRMSRSVDPRHASLLHRGDLIEHSRRPGLGLVRREIDLLRVGAERVRRPACRRRGPAS